jgi:hypothetical protein
MKYYDAVSHSALGRSGVGSISILFIVLTVVGQGNAVTKKRIRIFRQSHRRLSRGVASGSSACGWPSDLNPNPPQPQTAVPPSVDRPCFRIRPRSFFFQDCIAAVLFILSTVCCVFSSSFLLFISPYVLSSATRRFTHKAQWVLLITAYSSACSIIICDRPGVVNTVLGHFLI